MSNFWTAERIETLRKLVADGLAGSEIQTILGAKTRNVVIGKCARLGLSLGPKDEAGKTIVRKTKEIRLKSSLLASVSVKPEIVDPVPNLEELFPAAFESLKPKGESAFAAQADVKLVSWDDLTWKQCHWPFDTEGGRFFCGADKKSGSYCAPHSFIARAR
jgi:hypothetical protein